MYNILFINKLRKLLYFCAQSTQRWSSFKRIDSQSLFFVSLQDKSWRTIIIVTKTCIVIASLFGFLSSLAAYVSYAHKQILLSLSKFAA